MISSTYICTRSSSLPSLRMNNVGFTKPLEKSWDIRNEENMDNNRGSRAAALFDNLEEGGSRDIVDDDHENDKSLNSLQDQVVFLKRLRKNLTRTPTLIGIGFKKVERKLNHYMDLVDTNVLGLSDHEALKNSYIASMGVYVFRTEVLLELLKWKYPSCNDFGSEINPSKVKKCRIVDAIISHGCFLRDCSAEHSVVGIRSHLDEGVELKDTMMIGADYYQTD
ncbi:glucose-1-phosphate adenylyltransferase large subunit, chloroplastic/amyloplastic [Tanacetum coccineum]